MCIEYNIFIIFMIFTCIMYNDILTIRMLFTRFREAKKIVLIKHSSLDFELNLLIILLFILVSYIFSIFFILFVVFLVFRVFLLFEVFIAWIVFNLKSLPQFAHQLGVSHRECIFVIFFLCVWIFWFSSVYISSYYFSVYEFQIELPLKCIACQLQ